jgi:hypothetical protein
MTNSEMGQSMEAGQTGWSLSPSTSSAVLSYVVRDTVLKLLRELRIDQPVGYETFVDRLIDEVGWTWERREPDDTRRLINAAVENMMIDPLEKISVLSTERMTEQVKKARFHFERTRLVSFSLTDFGRTLIEGL